MLCPDVVTHTSKLYNLYIMLVFFIFVRGRDDTSPSNTLEALSQLYERELALEWP